MMTSIQMSRFSRIFPLTSADEESVTIPAVQICFNHCLEFTITIPQKNTVFLNF